MTLEALLATFVAGFLIPFKVAAAAMTSVLAVVFVLGAVGVALGAVTLYLGFWLLGKLEGHARFNRKGRKRG